MIKIFLTSKAERLYKPSTKKVFIFWKRNNGVKWKEKKSLLRNFILLWMKVLVSYNNFSASKYILSALLLTLPLIFYFSDLQVQTLYNFAFFCSRLLQKLCVCFFLVSNSVPSGACFIFYVSYCLFFYKKKTICNLIIQNINSEWVQRRAEVISIGQEHLSCTDRLRDLELFSLEKRWFCRSPVPFSNT